MRNTVRRVPGSSSSNHALMLFSGYSSPRAAQPDSSSSRGSSPGSDEEVPGVVLEQPALEVRRGRDTMVRTSFGILVSHLVTTGRLRDPAAMNVACCRMRVLLQPRTLRGKSLKSVAAFDDYLVDDNLTILKGFICDDPTGDTGNSAPCVNQDIIDKVSEILFYWCYSFIEFDS
jgi:hypothetical protein